MEQEGRKWLAYLAQSQVRGQKSLTVLAKMGRLHAFASAVDTPVGLELLKDLAARYDRLLSKVASLEASEEDKIEYRVVQEIITLWVARIDTYLKGIEAIEQEKGSPGR